MSSRKNQSFFSDPTGSRRGRLGRTPAVLLILFAIAVLCAILFTLLNPAVLKKAVLEAGGQVTMDLFVQKDPEKGKFLTDISGIDTAVTGIYAVGIEYDGKVYDCSLIIRDTTPPTGTAVPLTVEAGSVPDPQDLVTDAEDITGVTVSYRETPDFSTPGEVLAAVVLTDSAGNETQLSVPVTVVPKAGIYTNP